MIGAPMSGRLNVTSGEVLRSHPLLAGLTPDQTAAVEACAAAHMRFTPRQRIIEEGDEADGCYFVTAGDVAIELCTVGLLCTTIQTLHAGDVIGWSWLVTPHRWSFDAVALTEVEALKLDAGLLRETMRADPVLGSELLQGFCEVMESRLQAMTRRSLERPLTPEHDTLGSSP